MRKFLLIAVLVLLATALASAGVTYTVATTTTQDGQAYTMRVHTEVEGSSARIEILEGGPAPFKAGTWMVTRDGGKTFMVVDSERKTYFLLSPEATLSDVDARISQQAKVTNTKPVIARLSREPGTPLFGYPTSHARFRTTYTVTFKLVDSFTTRVTREDEVWAAVSLAGLSAKDAPALSAGAQMGIDPLAGDAAFRELGFPLKRISTTTSESVDGTVEKIVTTMEVREIHEGPIEAGRFQVPQDFKKVEFQPTTE